MQKSGNWLLWLDNNRDVVIGLLRIYVGLLLVTKGIQFISTAQHEAEYMSLIVTNEFMEFFSVQLVAIIHIAAGTCLALGLLTRISALVQIPLVVGALFFVSSKEMLNTNPQKLDFVMLLLCLLLVFALYGGGTTSLDYVLKKNMARKPKD